VAARARGLELEARLGEMAGVSMRSTYTLLHSEVTEPGDGGFGTLTKGLQLVRRPRRAGTLDAAWQRGRFGVNAIVTRVGARDDIDFGQFPAARVRLAPYSKVDLASRLMLLRGGGEQRRPNLTATVRVENAGNARFQNVFGYATPRRISYLGLRASR
jgi:outer membrane cobalamin receptor